MEPEGLLGPLAVLALMGLAQELALVAPAAVVTSGPAALVALFYSVGKAQEALVLAVVEPQSQGRQAAPAPAVFSHWSGKG